MRTSKRPADGMRLKAQAWIGGEIAIGPGKADLLEAIRATRSISAAARAMGLSYRRAWLMVDTMNRCFASALVETDRGGGGGGGAHLTAAGEQVLAAFRELEADITAAAQRRAPALIALLRARPIQPLASED